MLETIGGMIGLADLVWFLFGMIAPGKALPVSKPNRWKVAGVAFLVMGLSAGITSADPEVQARNAIKEQEQIEQKEAKAEERRLEEEASAVRARARKLEADLQNKRATAYSRSQKFVKERLKSPATAEFPSAAWDGDQIRVGYDDAEEIYTVASYVDSQNAFGATVRTNFIAQLQNTEGKTWQLLSLEMESR